MNPIQNPCRNDSLALDLLPWADPYIAQLAAECLRQEEANAVNVINRHASDYATDGAHYRSTL